MGVYVAVYVAGAVAVLAAIRLQRPIDRRPWYLIAAAIGSRSMRPSTAAR